MLQDDDGWTWKKSVIYLQFILTLKETKRCLYTTQQNPKTNVDGTKNYHSESESSLFSVTAKI